MNSRDDIFPKSHTAEQRPIRKEVRSKDWERLSPRFRSTAESVQKAIQGKGRHHRFGDLGAAIARAPPVKGELHARWECRTQEGRLIVNQGVDIRNGPRKELKMISRVANERTLQRPNVLGSVNVSHNRHKAIMHAPAVCMTIHWH